VQGLKAEAVLRGAGLVPELPDKPLYFRKSANSSDGEIYIMNHPRVGTSGYDVFTPLADITAIRKKLVAATDAIGGCICGAEALEVARIEAGIPRFGVDMDETNFPQECGIEERAVSYTKGCYIGQEVLNRIHTMGHVNRALCAIKLPADLSSLPTEVGHITSAATLPVAGKNVALALVRKEAGGAGTELTLRSAAGEGSVVVESLIH
jgi:folate-binding protein YgfZ